MSTLDLRATLCQQLDGNLRNLVIDVRALPEEVILTSPGGVARPPADFLVECAWMNLYLAGMFAGEPVEWQKDEQRRALVQELGTVDRVLEYLQGSVDKLKASVEALSDEQLAETSDKPFGFPMSRFAMAGLAAGHMMYHDGQLNLIQAMRGDGKFHWFG